MRDLQNSMEDFSRLHDSVIANLAPLTNFSDEQFSSALFIIVFASCICLFVIAHILPWRALALLFGWIAILAGHPRIAALIDAQTNQGNKQQEDPITTLRHFAETDISLSPERERREVEIFELQYRPLYNSKTHEWMPVVFSTTGYTPLSPARIAGHRPRGAKLFEDVAPPEGWVWADKKWSLDLLAKEWVEERMISGVEVEVEGGRWVVDVLEDVRPDDEQEEVERGFRKKNSSGYQIGEWRRRRWVRVVERVVVEGSSGD
jgi:Integral peroxisomal membrane peroxin